MCLVLRVDLAVRERGRINRLVLRFYKFFTNAFKFRVQVQHNSQIGEKHSEQQLLYVLE